MDRDPEHASRSAVFELLVEFEDLAADLDVVRLQAQRRIGDVVGRGERGAEAALAQGAADLGPLVDSHSPICRRLCSFLVGIRSPILSDDVAARIHRRRVFH